MNRVKIENIQDILEDFIIPLNKSATEEFIIPTTGEIIIKDNNKNFFYFLDTMDIPALIRNNGIILCGIEDRVFLKIQNKILKKYYLKNKRNSKTCKLKHITLFIQDDYRAYSFLNKLTKLIYLLKRNHFLPLCACVCFDRKQDCYNIQVTIDDQHKNDDLLLEFMNAF